MDLEFGAFDVIVSEWMGYGLLNEGMLTTVLGARDKYLAPDGLMAPSHVSVHLAPVSDAAFMAEHGTSWHDVRWLSLTLLAHIALTNAASSRSTASTSTASCLATLTHGIFPCPPLRSWGRRPAARASTSAACASRISSGRRAQRSARR